MSINEGKKIASDLAWEEAKEYYEKGDVESLEKQIRNETEVMIELADDCDKYMKYINKFIIASGVAALITGFIFYKLGECKPYKDFIKLCEEGNNGMLVRDTKTNLLYEIKAECIGD